jgi:gluconolactonase
MIVVCASPGVARADEVITASYPEGPLWQGERLYYAEMRADRVTVSEAGAERPFFVDRGCGPTAIASFGEGFLILCHLNASVVAVNASGRELRRWRHDAAGEPLTNPNDASADSRGGVYFSDPGPFSRAAGPRGRVMYLSAEGVLSAVAGPLNYPNGVHVAGDALYVSEHLAGRVLRYAIAAPGRLGDGEMFFDLAAAHLPPRYETAYALSGPDGLELGPEGSLYVAIYGDGRLLRVSPQGALLEVIDLPPRFLTNVAFGAGGRATTGAFDNTTAQSVGEVRIAP